MKNDDIEPPIMDFASLIEELSNGDVNRHLSEKTSDLIAAVKETGRKGREIQVFAGSPA